MTGDRTSGRAGAARWGSAWLAAWVVALTAACDRPSADAPAAGEGSGSNAAVATPAAGGAETPSVTGEAGGNGSAPAAAAPPAEAAPRASSEGSGAAPAAAAGHAASRPPLGADAPIVTIGVGVTETVVALGLAERVVGTDSSSAVHAAVAERATLGSAHRVGAEGVLALAPAAVLLGSAGPTPADLAAQLERAGVRVEQLGDVTSIEAVLARVQTIGAVVGRADEAAAVVAAARARLGEAAHIGARLPVRPRVLALYARGHGTLFVGGRNTLVDDVVRAAGADNAAAALDGFKPLTAEAVVAAAPTAIVVPRRGLDSVGGLDGMLAVPGVAQTPAGAARRIVVIDDHLLLGGGPGVADAVFALATALAAEGPAQ